MSEALLPCPFCGAKAHFEIDEGQWEWIECESCCMQGNRGASLMEDCKPMLAEAWNRRSDPLVERVKELEEALKRLLDAELDAHLTVQGVRNLARAALSKSLPDTVAEVK